MLTTEIKWSTNLEMYTLQKSFKTKEIILDLPF